jgi:hypothetical protein
MGSKSFNKSSWKCVFLAAAAALITALSPSVVGQTAAAASPVSFEALPAALSAAPRAAALAEPAAEPLPAAVPAPAPAPAIVITNDYRPMRPIAVRDHSRRNFFLMAAVGSAAASFDAYTTRRAVQQGAVEMNPLLKPFVNSNGLYAAIQVSPVIMDVVAYKLQHSENRFAHHMWWLPQALGTGVSLSAGVHNLGNIH